MYHCNNGLARLPTPASAPCCPSVFCPMTGTDTKQAMHLVASALRHLCAVFLSAGVHLRLEGSFKGTPPADMQYFMEALYRWLQAPHPQYTGRLQHYSPKSYVIHRLTRGTVASKLIIKPRCCCA